MKTLKTVLASIGVLLSTLTFQSCLDDDGYSLDKWAISVASIKADKSNAPYFKLDNGKTLWPAAGQINMSVLKNEQRVLLNYTLLGDSTTGAVGYDYYIRINRLDTILTKTVVENLGAKNDSVYGKDPVRITDMWTGNGHLTVGFETDFGNQRQHLVNLVKTDSVKSPYVFEFRQNAFDDPKITRAQGLVCFKLSNLSLPADTATTLTIRVNTFDGNKEYKVEYDPTGNRNKENPLNLTQGNLGKVK